MSPDIYAAFSNITTMADHKKVMFKPSRLRSSAAEDDTDDSNFVNPCDLAYATASAYLQEHAGSEFSQECFNNYWMGSGNDMSLSSSRFNDISGYIPDRNNSNGLNEVNINGQTYYQGQVSFYGTPYELSLGTVNVTYDKNFNPVGLQDSYDFDSQIGNGTRDATSEMVTNMVNVAGTICGAKPYTIKYGIFKK